MRSVLHKKTHNKGILGTRKPDKLVCNRCNEVVEKVNDEGSCKECSSKGEPPKKLLYVYSIIFVVVFSITAFVLYSLLKNKEDSVVPIIDVIPNSFNFNRKNSVLLNSEVVSNEITVEGINTLVDVKILNGFYSLNGEAWQESEGEVTVGMKIRVKHISSNNFAGKVKTTLWIGQVKGEFISQTKNKKICTDRDYALNLCYKNKN